MRKRINKMPGGGKTPPRNEWQQFYTDYLTSPKYRERLVNMGYDNPDQTIIDRLSTVLHAPIVNWNEEGRGSQFGVDGKVHILESDISKFGANRGSLIAHEYAHAAGQAGWLGMSGKALFGAPGNQINQNQIDFITPKLRPPAKTDTSKFNYITDAGETSADINALRFRLFQDKIYDTRTQDFNNDFLQKAKGKYKNDPMMQRLFSNVKDEDLVEMMNKIAVNDNNMPLEEAKKGGWIKHAVNPAHKGYCTPMTKSTCTPRRKALARTFKKHHGFHKHAEGGFTDPTINPLPAGSSLSKQDGRRPIQQDQYMRDALNFSIGQGVNPLSTREGNNMLGIPDSQQLISSAILFNQRKDLNGLSPEQRIQKYYGLNGTNPVVENYRRRSNYAGTGVMSNYETTPVQMTPQSIVSRLRGGAHIMASGGGLSRDKDYGSKGHPYPSVKSSDFAGGHRSYPIPTRADAVDALRLAHLHHRPDVIAKVHSKYPSLDVGGNIDTLSALKSRPDLTTGSQQWNSPQQPEDGRPNIRQALAGAILPLNIILGKLADSNAWQQSEEYRLSNLSDPLSILPRNDGQSEGVKYGYANYLRGGKTCLKGYCMGGMKKRYATGGEVDTFTPDEFDALDEPPHQDPEVVDNKQIEENDDLSNDRETRMAYDIANDSSFIESLIATPRRIYQDLPEEGDTPDNSSIATYNNLSLRGNSGQTKGSMAERNNNPGNLKFANWMAKYGAIPSDPGSDGGRFAKFPAPEQGLQAMQELLQKPSYVNKTVNQALKIYSNNGYDGSIYPEVSGKKVGNLTPEELQNLTQRQLKREDRKYYSKLFGK